MNQANPLTDQDVLLSRIGQGDEQAFRVLFDTYYGVMMQESYRLVGDESTANDVVQDVFVSIWRNRANLLIHGALYSYLKRATINQSLNYLKKSKKMVLYQDSTDVELRVEDPMVEQEITDTQTMLENKLGTIINTLPERCRIVFELSRFEKMSHKQIAEQLGISIKTVENQITKAMHTLRNAIKGLPNLPLLIIFSLFLK
jgi:RNA polymerase sigma-70 factor, ECF subfamily